MLPTFLASSPIAWCCAGSCSTALISSSRETLPPQRAQSDRRLNSARAWARRSACGGARRTPLLSLRALSQSAAAASEPCCSAASSAASVARNSSLAPAADGGGRSSFTFGTGCGSAARIASKRSCNDGGAPAGIGPNCCQARRTRSASSGSPEAASHPANAASRAASAAWPFSLSPSDALTLACATSNSLTRLRGSDACSGAASAAAWACASCSSWVGQVGCRHA